VPFNNAYGAIVTAMDTSNVDTVFIAGRVMKRSGKLVRRRSRTHTARNRGLARLSRREVGLVALGYRHEPPGH